MTPRWLLTVAAVTVSGTSGDGHVGSTRFDINTHVAVRSAGCGKKSPYKAGKTSVATGKYAGTTWTYRVYVPKKYNHNTPMPLIIQHPGWGMAAKEEEKGCGIGLYADQLGFISVTAQGGNDNSHYGGPWYSWNAAGTTQSPGPGGPTCTNAASTPSNCYSSCPCKDKPQCDWATCLETGPTPTGTGTSDIGGFIPSLYDTLEDQLCIDTTREYAAGESNGGIMTYQLGVDLSSRLAAIAPQFGSFHKGFNMAPRIGVPVIDIHGFHDTTVPANVSTSAGGYFYTITAEIFGGNKYTSGKGWKSSNGCSGKISHYPTRFDGVDELYCVSEGTCTGGDVVRCAWNGGHNWFGNKAEYNGGLVTDFLTRWAKTTHIGKGYSEGMLVGRGHPLTNVEIEVVEDADALDTMTPDALEPAFTAGRHGRHYSDPATGCQADEDIVFAGTGRVCAPRMGTSVADELESLPTPLCKLGGVTPSRNGCPLEASAFGEERSHAWPICLAKTSTHSIDPYAGGEFHCLLVCPCPGGRDDCGPAAHAHCPGRAKCERGELLKRDQGVCTYHDVKSPMAINV